MNRRELLKGFVLGSALVATGRMGLAGAKPALEDAGARLAMLERKHGGRLGVAMLDTGSGKGAGHRADVPFLMCSTFKLLLVAAVLKRVDRGEEKLDRRIVYGKDVLLDWAPVTSKHVGPPGLTIAELCGAAITLSDNTAANLLITRVGGPAAVTEFARSLGDLHTVLDRMEPELNPRDTTTPNSMLGDMQKLLLGDVLSRASRGQLTQWLLDCQTGLQSLRAGVPNGWRVGDKTGQWDGNGTGANNDIAVIWPPGRKPLLVAAYYMTRTTDVAARKAVLAEVGRIAATLV